MANKQESKESTRKPFKDWFDNAAAIALSDQIGGVYKDFDKPAFRRSAVRNLQSLEFNDRVKQFSAAMAKHLPAAYPTAIKILVKSLPPKPVDAASITDGWLQWPLGQFIADYGTGHVALSLDSMLELTQRFSSEFAVRPFVDQHPDETFKYLLNLTDHSSEHVRRWCSEGTRSRLPWGIKLNNVIDNPAPVWKILDQLIDDESIYVRKSVANSINDLCKDHPQQVLEQCRVWKKTPSPARDWIIRHGLRTLIKQGDVNALQLVGFDLPRKLKVEFSVSPKSVSVGDVVTLAASVENHAEKTQSLMLDYAVDYVRKNNTCNQKVFKWKVVELAPGAVISISKKHPMKATTIRTLYSGAHKVQIQINGIKFAASEFVLK